MKKIIVLTPTYNHPEHLKLLYESLKKQLYKNFIWLIVDDGSKIETFKTIEKFQKEDILDIKYIRQENQGKSSAINQGFNEISTELFVLIVDDDEYLFENALENVSKYVDKYKDTNCGVIDFLHSFKNKKNDYKIKEDYFMTLQERKNRRLDSDGYTGYFVKALKNTRFPIYKNEKYIGPSVLLMLVSKNWQVLWSNCILGETEYLEKGITAQGRKLRINNPQGMIHYCMLLQEEDSNIFIKLKYSIYAYAYLYYSKLGKKIFIKNNIDFNKFIFWAKFPGFILNIYWRIKYNK